MNAPLRSLVRLGGSPRGAIIQAVGALAGGLVAAFVAATMDSLFGLILAAGIALVVLSARWPLLLLFIFVALIPIEDSLNIAGFGTLSRWAGIAFAGVYAIPRLGRLVPGALPLAGWAYIGWAVLSVAWALDPGTAQGQLQTLVQLAVIAFLVSDVVIHEPAVVRPLLWAYSLSAGATAALGISVFLVGGVAADGRAAAIAGQNPAQFASLLLPALIFSLYEVLHGRRVAASGLVALLCTAGIVLSGTRSVWLAAVVVIFFLMIPRLGIRRAIVALGVVSLLAVATLQIPGVGGLVANRAETAASSGGAGRTDIWAVGLEIFQASPVIGSGYANFPAAFTTSVLRSANVGVDIGTGRAPHNIVIGTAGELGLVGLGLLALFIVPLVIRRGWGPDGAIVQAILASLMVDALFLDIVGNRKQVWVAIGLAAGLAYLARQVRGRGDVPAKGTPATVRLGTSGSATTDPFPAPHRRSVRGASPAADVSR